jgi:hypothetical protein
MGGGMVCNCNNVQEKVDPAYMHVRTSLLGGILGGQEESISMCRLSQLIIFIQDTFLCFFVKDIAFY